jgi:hypothetical protein
MAIPAIPRMPLAITWVSVGGAASTTGVLIQNMPMPPRLGGVRKICSSLLWTEKCPSRVDSRGKLSRADRRKNSALSTLQDTGPNTS